MMRKTGLILALLLALGLTACGGGGGTGNTSNSGLSPLDFDVVTDPGSSVSADTVIGYAVEKTNPMYARAASAVPENEELVAVLLFEPQTDPGAGFSGDFTVRTEDRSASAIGEGAFGVVYRGIWDSRSEVWATLRSGIYSHGTGGSFRFHLDFLGPVVLTRPKGEQFYAAAFADISTAPVNTVVNFWAFTTGEGEVAYQWRFGDGTTATGQEVSHSYPLIGEYNVSLTATDSAGNVAPVSSTAISIVANPMPLSEVDVVVNKNPDGSFTYNATLDGGTPPFDYEWDFDSDGNVDSTAGAHPTFTPSQPGVYVFELRVTDQTGATASTSGIADGRTIALNANPNPAYWLTDVAFDVVTTGTDASDTVVIDFGDGDTAVSSSLLHQYDQTGVFTAKAMVTRLVGGSQLTQESAPVLVQVDPRPAPRIDSLTPARAPVGAEVTIAGEFYFLPEVDDEVLIGLLPMPVVSWDSEQIVVQVPQGARDGNIVVHKALGDLDSNAVPFDVAPTPPGEPGLGQL